ncbi:MAG: hypothetical protein AAB493_01245 [Patescibacteria group bacterium]
MKALAIKINTYKTGVNIVDNNNLKRRILSIMLVIFGALTLCYVIFLGNTVFNIVERTSLSKESRILSNEVGKLELEYISISNKVNLSLATSLGFKESKEKQYTTRKSLVYIPLGSRPTGDATKESLDNIKLAKNEL